MYPIEIQAPYDHTLASALLHVEYDTPSLMTILQDLETYKPDELERTLRAAVYLSVAAQGELGIDTCLNTAMIWERG